MVLSSLSNRYFEINHIVQVLRRLEIDCQAIQKLIVTLRPPTRNTKIFMHWNRRFMCRFTNFTCGYLSKSNCKCPAVGCGEVSSYPAHISNNKWPKQMISIFSTSLTFLDHTTAFTFELNPKRPFSSPDNLFSNEIYTHTCSSILNK